ncbi:hypothetical protein [Sorangium cellulosum]|uniref:Uncharacterized protein n=1 Tax=Sorangium cellulosum So0157-2 TaxID=1254432 RepID=S4XN69_SORCE|nr:hypothetical protein [Sorangium cellulosum]AGP33856.1 hypothetical protein SCE1572_04700 [Sorangium cellulosum So0157-2]
MTRKIITAAAALSLFAGMALAHVSTPAASSLEARSVLGAEASAATPEGVAFYGFPAANVPTTTQVDLAGIASGTSGVVSQAAVAQAAVAQAGGIGDIGGSTANAQGFQGRGYGGWRGNAMNGASGCGRADVRFGN